MLAKIFRKVTAAPTVEFCDSCARVCTSACRAEARYGRARQQAAMQVPLIR